MNCSALSGHRFKSSADQSRPPNPECRKSRAFRIGLKYYLVDRDKEELAEFLSQTNHQYLLPEFEKHNFGYHELVTNTEFVLNKIGVEDVKTIRKLSAHIILLHKQDWKKESLKELDLDTNLT